MNSSRPYLVRALYEQIVDSDYAPHILVNAEFVGVKVPPGHVSDGQIVLNVSPSAVWHLHIDNEAVSFKRCFGGVAQSLHIPALTVTAIYAWENDQGMVFDLEQSGPVGDEPGDDDGGLSDESSCSSGRPSLEVVR